MHITKHLSRQEDLSSNKELWVYASKSVTPKTTASSLYLITLSPNPTALVIHHCHFQTEPVLRKPNCLAVIVIR